VYMIQPKGFVKTRDESKVCRLFKVIYGLKQTPRTWYMIIDFKLKLKGFIKSNVDYNCNYVKFK
jgi:hypothetical protein